MRYLSKIIGAKTSYMYTIYREDEAYVAYRNYGVFDNNDRTPRITEILIPLYFEEEILNRNILNAELTFRV